MRISDWSSDVCSSDLPEVLGRDRQVPQLEGPALTRRGLPAPPEVGPVVVHAASVTASTVVVAVDVGKNEFAVSATDAARVTLLKPRLGCPMTAPALREVIHAIQQLMPDRKSTRL